MIRHVKRSSVTFHERGKDVYRGAGPAVGNLPLWSRRRSNSSGLEILPYEGSQYILLEEGAVEDAT